MGCPALGRMSVGMGHCDPPGRVWPEQDRVCPEAPGTGGCVPSLGTPRALPGTPDTSQLPPCPQAFRGRRTGLQRTPDWGGSPPVSGRGSGLGGQDWHLPKGSLWAWGGYDCPTVHGPSPRSLGPDSTAFVQHLLCSWPNFGHLVSLRKMFAFGQRRGGECGR